MFVDLKADNFTEYDFYGVDGNYFKLDDIVFEVVEDEDDGYRSAMEGVRIVTDKRVVEEKLIFFDKMICKVVIKDDDEYDGYKLVDDSGHIWLRFGTDSSDSYYPCFMFVYEAKEDKDEFSRGKISYSGKLELGFELNKETEKMFGRQLEGIGPDNFLGHYVTLENGKAVGKVIGCDKSENGCFIRVEVNEGMEEIWNRIQSGNWKIE